MLSIPGGIRGHRLCDLRENRRVVDGGRHGIFFAVGNFAQYLSQDLAGARLRQSIDHERPLEICERANGLSNHLHELLLEHFVRDCELVRSAYLQRLELSDKLS